MCSRAYDKSAASELSNAISPASKKSHPRAKSTKSATTLPSTTSGKAAQEFLDARDVQTPGDGLGVEEHRMGTRVSDRTGGGDEREAGSHAL